MRLLFLLSSLEPAGSETYCVSLAKAWANKHDIFWISDRLHFNQRYTSLPISAKIFPRGIGNVFNVARFIRANNIQLVHSHSRRAHWVASHAAKLTGIVHVTTVHQPPPIHLFSRLQPCLGDATIAVSEEARDRAVHGFAVPASHVHLIRNGITIPPSPAPRPPSSLSTILLLGRLTGGRWQAYQFFLDVLKRLAPQLPAAHYQVAGRIPEEQRAFIHHQVLEANSRIRPSSLEVVDWTPDLPSLINNADVVIGAGRSALESMAVEKPVIVLGERGVLGLCQPDLWRRCQQTNFSDHQEQKEFYPARLELALRQVLDPKADWAAWGKWGRQQVIRDYNIDDIAPHVEAVYNACICRS